MFLLSLSLLLLFIHDIRSSKEEAERLKLQSHQEYTKRNYPRKHYFGEVTTTLEPVSVRTTLAPCLDKSRMCCFWAVAGECDSNPFWMRTNCPRSCGTCNCPLLNASGCVSSGIKCILPTSTTLPTTPPTTITTTTTVPPTKLGTLKNNSQTTVKSFKMRPYTPPSNGFGRTRSTTKLVTQTTTQKKLQERRPVFPTTTTRLIANILSTTVKPIQTTTESLCSDLESHCIFWAAFGECHRNSYWMQKYCQRSCKTCSDTQDRAYKAALLLRECKDIEKSCSFWSIKGECNINTNWMITNCPKSCRVC